MGTFILWLGWYGFNPGSTLGLAPAGYARDAARVVVTTTISAGTGGVTVILLEKMCGDKTWNVGAVCKCVLRLMKVDDPLDAFAVHGACGFWGVFVVGLLASDHYAYASGKGLFYGSGQALGCAVVTLFAEIAWVGIMSFIMFFPLKKVGLLRVSAEVEAAGMDVSKHGGAAYESTTGA